MSASNHREQHLLLLRHVRDQVGVQQRAESTELEELGVPGTVDVGDLAGQCGESRQLDAQVRVMCALQMIDEERRAHRHPIGCPV